MNQFEYFFQCPHCWEQISMLIDSSQNQQHYIEDCEVCCNPIQLNFRIEADAITDFSAKIVQ
ncbi:CPXCG motif-containing cysteine-rich protein [Winogradskyella sp. 3972H.M.0a.05]|uniref:CPXCG motif-containing cysteine-rich protein n=1 Tax=Winogradskyella sp. 3972H.M.0a.05 TaxID=2950277 RepID=UPI0033960200